MKPNDNSTGYKCMIVENKSLNKFQYFVQRHIKNSIPKAFPQKGSWVTLELIDTSSGAKVIIPALLAVVKNRLIQVKTRLPFPNKCSKNGKLYCTFESSVSEKGVFQGSKSKRYFTNFEIFKMISNKTANIKLIDSIFKRANQREFERLPYKRNYNIGLYATQVPENNNKIAIYNKIVREFIENLEIKDIAPGGLGGVCKKKHAAVIKVGHKIHVNICFGQRMEYRFYKKLITSKTVKRILKTHMTVVKILETEGDNYILGFRFQDVEKHRYFILDESNRIRLSEAALTASGVDEF